MQATDPFKQGTIAIDLFHLSSQRWHFKRLFGGPDVSRIGWCITHQLSNGRRRTGSHCCGRASPRWRPPTTVKRSRRSGIRRVGQFRIHFFKVEWICNTAGISSKPMEHATRMSPITRRQLFETSSVGNGKCSPLCLNPGTSANRLIGSHFFRISSAADLVLLANLDMTFCHGYSVVAGCESSKQDVGSDRSTTSGQRATSTLHTVYN